MKKESFNMRLQKIENTLSNSETLIANYVLTNLEKIPSLSITELADAAQTSASSITRFCQRLDYRNFNDFKTLVENDLIHKVEPANSIENIAMVYQEVLSETSHIVLEKDLKDFSDTLIKSNKIVVIGIGSSGLTAIEFSVRLARMGLHSQSITDSYNMISQAFLLNSKDTLIVISNSGETSEIIKASSIAKENNVNIQVITKYENSSLTSLANNVYLTSKSTFSSNNVFVNDQLASLFFVDVITNLLLTNDELSKNYIDTLNILFKKNKN